MGRTIKAVAAAAALMLLAACGARPAADPPPTHTTTQSTTAAPKPPVMPAVAQEHTKSGAKAFVQYYWDVVNYADSSLDTDALRSLSDESCVGCRGGAAVLDAIRDSGGVLQGGAYTVKKVVVAPNDANLYYTRVTVTHGQQEVVGGTSPTAYPSGTTDFVMVLVADKAGWRVDRLDGAT